MPFFVTYGVSTSHHTFELHQSVFVLPVFSNKKYINATTNILLQENRNFNKNFKSLGIL